MVLICSRRAIKVDEFLVFAESCENAGDHNLDLSLGSSSSKREMGENVGQNSSAMQFEMDWRQQGVMSSKVVL